MDSCGLALFEARLVHLRGDLMWARLVDLLQDGLLHDLRHMGPDNDRSDFVEAHWTFHRRFLKWYKATNPEILRDSHSVESVGDLRHYFLG